MGKLVATAYDRLTYRINGSAMKVARRLGPGYREEIYQRALEAQFTEDGLAFAAEKYIEVFGGGVLLGYYIPDFIVEETVIVELKAFATLHQKYLGQVVTYLNYTGLPIGLLMNFGERYLHPRRIFPSANPAENAIDHQWIFMPDWLRAQRQEGRAEREPDRLA